MSRWIICLILCIALVDGDSRWIEGPCESRTMGIDAYGEGLLPGRTGIVRSFTIAKDPHCVDAQFQITITPSAEVTSWMRPEGDNIFHVFYRANLDATYNINITTQRGHLRGSPFSIDVTARGPTLLRPAYEGDPRIPLFFWGPQNPTGGISIVNYNFYKQFVRDPDLRVSIWNVADQYYSSDPRFQQTLRSQDSKFTTETHQPAPADDLNQITISHNFPPAIARERAGIRVIYFPWECTSVPINWITLLRQTLSEVWAPTTYVRSAWIQSGMPPHMVHVIPYGVDATVFHPDIPPMELATKAKFKFLYNSGLMSRKGVDIVIEAYKREFKAHEDVALVMNIAYRGLDQERWTDNVQTLQAHKPQIVLMLNKLPLDYIPSLYTAADCMIQPYRAEGFGMTMLEAMASGLPVIATGGGAAMDFLTNDTAYLIPAVEKTCGHPCMENGTRLWMLYNDTNGPVAPLLAEPCKWLEPDLHSTMRLMRYVFEHQDEAKEVGRRAREKALQHNWERAYQAVKERMAFLWRNREHYTFPANDDEKAHPKSQIPFYTVHRPQN